MALVGGRGGSFGRDPPERHWLNEHRDKQLQVGKAADRFEAGPSGTVKAAKIVVPAHLIGSNQTPVESDADKAWEAWRDWRSLQPTYPWGTYGKERFRPPPIGLPGPAVHPTAAEPNPGTAHGKFRPIEDMNSITATHQQGSGHYAGREYSDYWPGTASWTSKEDPARDYRGDHWSYVWRHPPRADANQWTDRDREWWTGEWPKSFSEQSARWTTMAENAKWGPRGW